MVYSLKVPPQTPVPSLIGPPNLSLVRGSYQEPGAIIFYIRLAVNRKGGMEKKSYSGLGFTVLSLGFRV